MQTVPQERAASGMPTTYRSPNAHAVFGEPARAVSPGVFRTQTQSVAATLPTVSVSVQQARDPVDSVGALGARIALDVWEEPSGIAAAPFGLHIGSLSEKIRIAREKTEVTERLNASLNRNASDLKSILAAHRVSAMNASSQIEHLQGVTQRREACPANPAERHSQILSYMLEYSHDAQLG